MRSRKQAGLTLVEILVALALSAVLVTALYRIVGSNQQGMQLTESYAKIQDTSRTAFDLLQHDLRMAGYRGCIAEPEDLTDLNLKSYLKQPSASEPSVVYDSEINDYTGALISTPTNAFGSIESSDSSSVIILRKGIAINALVAEETDADNFKVTGPKEQLGNLKAGDILMVSDCEEGAVFVLTGVDTSESKVRLYRTNAVTASGLVNDSAELPVKKELDATNYPVGSQVLLMQTVMYFIAPSKLLDGENTKINSLYGFDSLNGNSSESRELVPYVEQMQLEYLVKEGDKRVYRNVVSGNQPVYAVRVTLTMETEQTCGKPKANSQSCIDPQTYERVFYIRNSRSEIE